MILRYDYIDRLDLSIFRKQASHYIARMQNVNCFFFTKDYRLLAEIGYVRNQNNYTVNIYFSEIIRNENNEIDYGNNIDVTKHPLFEDILSIKSLFEINPSKAIFIANNIQEIIDRLCYLVKILHKINNLKIFA